MGLFTKDKVTFAEGLEKYGKGLSDFADAQQRANDEAAAARKHEAKMQRLAQEQEKESKDRAENAYRASEYTEIANEGTAEAYRRLFYALFTEKNRQFNNYTANNTLKKSLTLQNIEKGYDNVDKVKELLKGFSFVKDPEEFHKTFIFLLSEFKEHPSEVLEQLSYLQTAVEMNSHNSDIAALLPEIKTKIEELKERQKEELKKVMKYILYVIAAGVVLFLLVELFSAIGDDNNDISDVDNVENIIGVEEKKDKDAIGNMTEGTSEATDEMLKVQQEAAEEMRKAQQKAAEEMRKAMGQ